MTRGPSTLDRRLFVTGLGAGLALRPLAAGAQQKDARRVGMLIAVGQTPEYLASVAAFENELARHGWKIGESVVVDVLWSTGNPKRTHAAIDELLARKPDVILAQSEGVVRTLLKTTRSVPVVFVHVADPVTAGFVTSMARPDGNITGFTNTTPTLVGKWLQLLKQISPSTSRVAMLFNPETAAGRGSVFVTPFLQAGQALKIETMAAAVHSKQDIDATLASLAEHARSGFVIAPDPFLAGHASEIVAQAKQKRLPSVFPYRYYVASGGLLSYGINNKAMFAKSASYVDRVLRGTPTTELPIQQPDRFELTLNGGTAKAFGLNVPPSIYAEASEVIE